MQVQKRKLTISVLEEAVPLQRLKINFSLDVPGNRKTFIKPVLDLKNVSGIEPPAGHMTCTSSTVYVGDLIIMDRHYDGYGHLLSAITFLYDINSLVPPLSLSSYPITIIVVIVLTVSHALTKKAS